MKFAAFVLLAVLGAASASLSSDIQDLKNLIPMDQLQAITEKYKASGDVEFLEMVAYSQSSEFTALQEDILNSTEWRAFDEYMQVSGVDVIPILTDMWNVIWAVQLNSRRFNPRYLTADLQRSVLNYFNELKAAVPFDRILILVTLKRLTSSEFRTFWGRLENEQCQTIVEALLAQSGVVTSLQKARDYKIDIDLYIALMYTTFGWVA